MENIKSNEMTNTYKKSEILNAKYDQMRCHLYKEMYNESILLKIYILWTL
jgi:hypothetical protein